MISKTDIKKPYIYIATALNGMKAEHSALEIAEAIQYNPFIGAIYTLEAVYSKEVMAVASEQVAQDVAVRSEIELQLADIVIIDMRNGDPVELGHVIATGKPFVIYNPTDFKVHPMAHGKAKATVSNLAELADLNYLKIKLNA